MIGRGHLAGVFRWTPDEDADWVAFVGAAIGMAAPILAGTLAGHASWGYAAALGGLLIGGVGAGRSFRAQVRTLFHALVPTVLAGVLAAALVGRGATTDAVAILLAVAAAAVGGLSRALALGTTRFIAFLIIAIPAAQYVPERAVFALMVAAGAALTVAVCLLLGALARARRGGGEAAAGSAPAEPPGERLRRWGRSLLTLDGWQYAIRIAFCLGVAAVLRWHWPDHHLQWIAISVALVAERQLETFPVKMTQRALGTALGVLATSLVLGERLPLWALVLITGLLAGARPMLKFRNYLTYAVIMTPLVVIVMDAGRSTGGGILLDRLVAVGIAAVLLISANAVVGRLVRARA